MPTLAKTGKTPFNFAVTKKAEKVLALDSAGLINVVTIDSTFDEVTKLGLSKSVQIPLFDLANATLLSHICSKNGLQPGRDAREDASIVETLKKNMSSNILNPEVVILEIIASWNFIAQISRMESEIKAFIPAPEEMIFAKRMIHPNPTLVLFLNQYTYQYLKTLPTLNDIGDATWVFLQASELLESIETGRNYSVDPRDQKKSLLARANRCMKDLPESRQLLTAIVKKIEAENFDWYNSLIVSIIEFEIMEALDEPALNKEKLKQALRHIVQGTYENITDDVKVAEALEDSIDFVVHGEKAKNFSTICKAGKKPTPEAIRLAISARIARMAESHGVSLESEAIPEIATISSSPASVQPPSKKAKSLVDLACSEAPEDTAALFSQLFNMEEFITGDALRIVLGRTRNETIKDLIRQRLNNLPKTEATPSAVTPAFSSSAKRRLSFERLPDERRSDEHRPDKDDYELLSDDASSNDDGRDEKRLRSGPGE